VKQAWSRHVTTVFPRQGHYATDPQVLRDYPPADLSIDEVRALLRYDRSAFEAKSSVEVRP
jgi:hypothetical protein